MSSIPRLTGWDKLDLADAASAGVQFMIDHYREIENIANRLCNDDPGTALRDILDKGLLELQKICEMDEEVCREQTDEITCVRPVKEVWKE